MPDKRNIRIVSASAFVVLLVVFLVPYEIAGRVVAACALVAIATAASIIIKKRECVSINKNQILLIMSVMAFLYVVICYVTGLFFGLVKNPYALSARFILERFAPAAVIIASSEVFRYVMRAQRSKFADVFSYLTCVLAEMIICSTAGVAISSFNHFMELVSATMCPALTANLLYHYTSRRYGFYPNIIYRAITSLYIYFIPYTPNIPKPLLVFFNLLVPLAIYLFISTLYERKRRYALKKKSKIEIPLIALALAFMLSVVMLVSNRFHYGAYVIGTPSMTGELNVGDLAIYEKYDGEIIQEGQVIAFERYDNVIIHRVEEIQVINGSKLYFTKGDANNDRDAGYVSDGEIIGVVNMKISYVGYPNLWMRKLFNR